MELVKQNRKYAVKSGYQCIWVNFQNGITKKQSEYLLKYKDYRWRHLDFLEEIFGIEKHKDLDRIDTIKYVISSGLFLLTDYGLPNHRIWV